MYKHQYNVLERGLPLNEAQNAVIFLHGRGSTAENILSLSAFFEIKNTSFFAPQATNNSWYPHSFLANVEENQPALDSALNLINTLVEKIERHLESKKVYFLGFSQGACLTLEYIFRHAKPYGGVVAFTGGLISKEIGQDQDNQSLEGTPILLSTANPDPHVPLSRVEASKVILERKGAKVHLSVFDQKPHNITQEELELAKKIIS